MTKFPDPTKVVKRVIELLGGVEKTRQITDQELGDMNRRWNQDIESIGRILRAHLYVEHYMTEYLSKANPHLGSVEKGKLSFAQKLALLDPNDLRLQEVKEGIKHLNVIRNRLAHRLSATVTADDSAIFLRALYFGEMREERASTLATHLLKSSAWSAKHLREQWRSVVSPQPPNLSVNTDRLQAALAGSLRGFAAPAAGYLKR